MRLKTINNTDMTQKVDFDVALKLCQQRPLHLELMDSSSTRR